MEIFEPVQVEGLFCHNPIKKDDVKDKDAMWFFPKLGYSTSIGGEIQEDLGELKKQIPVIARQCRVRTETQIQELQKKLDKVKKYELTAND